MNIQICFPCIFPETSHYIAKISKDPEKVNKMDIKREAYTHKARKKYKSTKNQKEI